MGYFRILGNKFQRILHQNAPICIQENASGKWRRFCLGLNVLILHNQYHGCSRLNETKNMIINCHDGDVVLPESSKLNTSKKAIKYCLCLWYTTNIMGGYGMIDACFKNRNILIDKINTTIICLIKSIFEYCCICRTVRIAYGRKCSYRIQIRMALRIVAGAEALITFSCCE